MLAYIAGPVKPCRGKYRAEIIDGFSGHSPARHSRQPLLHDLRGKAADGALPRLDQHLVLARRAQQAIVSMVWRSVHQRLWLTSQNPPPPRGLQASAGGCHRKRRDLVPSRTTRPLPFQRNARLPHGHADARRRAGSARRTAVINCRRRFHHMHQFGLVGGGHQDGSRQHPR